MYLFFMPILDSHVNLCYVWQDYNIFFIFWQMIYIEYIVYYIIKYIILVFLRSMQLYEQINYFIKV